MSLHEPTVTRPYSLENISLFRSKWLAGLLKTGKPYPFGTLPRSEAVEQGEGGGFVEDFVARLAAGA